jgi:hypothetical protein
MATTQTHQPIWLRVSALLLGMLLLGVAAFATAPTARADCDASFSIVPADGSFSYAITPICGSDVSNADVTVWGPGVAIVTNVGDAVVRTGVGGVGYTRPGDTPYVNGQPERSPYSNVRTMTPAQAAAARASGNASATGNAYSQYGGFAPPGETATQEQSPGTVVRPY